MKRALLLFLAAAFSFTAAASPLDPPGRWPPTSFAPLQAIIASTGVRVQLPSNALVFGSVVCTASSGNSAAGLLVGTSSVTGTANGSGNGYVLYAGRSVSLTVSNTNLVYINGTAGDWLSCVGS